MLKAYRRHDEDCPHRSEGITWTRCNCWIAVDGPEDLLKKCGLHRGKSLKTRNWKEAQQRLLLWNSGGQVVPGHVRVADTVDQFMKRCESNNKQHGTLKNYKQLLARLVVFADAQGYQFISQLDMLALEQFQQSWGCAPSTAGQYLVQLRTFFKYVVNRGLLTHDPAAKLERPKFTRNETLPFEPHEIDALMTTLSELIEEVPAQERAHYRRLRALLWVLRYSGLRIEDAIQLDVDRLRGDELFLRAQKNKVPVNVVLPQLVLKELDCCPRMSEHRWFSKDGATLAQREQKYREIFTLVCKRAKVVNGHHTFHRFRDTFAVGRLLLGDGIEEVRVLLGHKSILTTMRHYAPWVRPRQDQLNDKMRKGYANDPLLQRHDQPQKLRRIK